MKIRDILSTGKPTISMEVFPPKTEANFSSVEKAVREIATIQPSFMSVTYGAGGGTSAHTVKISSIINELGVPALAHLSCVSSTKERVAQQLAQLKAMNIENILALRGDKPEDLDESKLEYHYANELVEEIRAYGDFCIGGACYPEGHPEAPDWKTDIINLKRKVDAGCDFLTTQMFFDNNILYNFLYRLREKGVTVPVIAGIMPVTRVGQVENISRLSQAFLPRRFHALVDRFGSDPLAMQQAGIAYATDQIIDLLANGINNIHIYTMNKPEVAKAIRDNLSHIL